MGAAGSSEMVGVWEGVFFFSWALVAMVRVH